MTATTSTHYLSENDDKVWRVRPIASEGGFTDIIIETGEAMPDIADVEWRGVKVDCEAVNALIGALENIKSDIGA